MTDLPTHATGYIVRGVGGREITAGDRVCESSFVPADGPRHTGTVRRMKCLKGKAPVVVIDMDDGTTAEWGTTWTSEGPWNLEAPYRTRSGRVI